LDFLNLILKLVYLVQYISCNVVYSLSGPTNQPKLCTVSLSCIVTIKHAKLNDYLHN